jgi:caffeoyl-CoA O-methyltransferase
MSKFRAPFPPKILFMILEKHIPSLYKRFYTLGRCGIYDKDSRETLFSYCISNSKPSHVLSSILPLLRELENETKKRYQERADKMVSILQGIWLYDWVSRSKSIERVLDLGTFTGMSSICMASGLSKDNTLLITCDVDIEAQNIAKKYIDQCELDMIQIKNKSVINALDEFIELKIDPFDLIFIDADKKNIPLYIEKIIQGRLLSKDHGTILIDNVLFHGEFFDKSKPMSSTAKSMHATNNILSKHHQVDQYTIMPIFDGIGILKLKIQDRRVL